jgi:hypothetical protein
MEQCSYLENLFSFQKMHKTLLGEKKSPNLTDPMIQAEVLLRTLIKYCPKCSIKNKCIDDINYPLDLVINRTGRKQCR